MNIDLYVDSNFNIILFVITNRMCTIHRREPNQKSKWGIMRQKNAYF